MIPKFGKKFASCDLYTIYEPDLHEIDSLNYLYKSFIIKAIQYHNLQNTLNINQMIMNQQVNSFYFPQNFLYIQKKYKTNVGFMYQIERYQCTLNEYISNRMSLTEHQALEIFDQIIKAIYSLHVKGYTHHDLRSDHFVKCENVWKLQSVVTSTQTKQELDSQYIASRNHYPPEFYENGASQENQMTEKIQRKIVWNLGCILIHLLTGSHKLKQFIQLKRFKNSTFSFQKIGIKDHKFSQPLTTLLGRMCHYNYKERMKLQELFSSQLLSPSVYKVCAKQKSMEGQVSYLNIKNPYSDQTPNKSISLLKEKPPMLYEQSNIKIVVGEQNKIENQIPHEENSFLFIVVDEPKTINPKVSQLLKSKIDCCQLLKLQDWEYNQIMKFIEEEEKGREDYVATAVKYTLLLTKSILLREIIDEDECQQSLEKSFYSYDIPKGEFAQFKKTQEYSQLINSAKQMRRLADKEAEQTKGFLIYLAQIQQVNNQDVGKLLYLEENDKNFITIKKQYRNTLYNLLIKSMIQSQKERNKQNHKLIYLIARATYWIAFYKLYVKGYFEHFFSDYFEWTQEKPSLYVNADKFLTYLNQIKKQKLMKWSQVILDKFFSFES